MHPKLRLLLLGLAALPWLSAGCAEDAARQMDAAVAHDAGDASTLDDGGHSDAGNSAPVLSEVTLGPDGADRNATLTCVPGTTTDADGTTSFTFSYAWSVNGAPITTTDATLAGEFVRGDVVTCTVTPSDGIGEGAPVTSNQITIANAAPSVTGATISPAVPVVGDVLVCAEVGYLDADGDASASSYVWAIDGNFAGSGPTLSGGFVGGDEVTCTVTPHDGVISGPGTASAQITIANTAPVISSVTLTPTIANETSTLTCTPVGSDADGDTLTYSYTWRVAGQPIAATTSTLNGTDFDRDDTVACIATPWDGSAFGAAVASNTITIVNAAPIVTSVTLTPTTAYEGSTLICTPSGSDPEGDTVTYAYAWRVNGADIAATTSTLSGIDFNRGDTVDCTATPHDGIIAGAAVRSATITIANTAPVMTSVTLNPSAPRSDQAVTCNVTAADADADVVTFTYQWYLLVTPVPAAAGGTAQVLPPATGRRGRDVYCVATPKDSTSSGTPMTSSSATYLNTPPYPPSIDIGPTRPHEDDSLSCGFQQPATDYESDSITYDVTWTRNGIEAFHYSSVTGTTGTPYTVPAAATELGDEWSCSVTASDFLNASSPQVTATTTVLCVFPEVLGYEQPFASPGAGAAVAGQLRGQRVVMPYETTIASLGAYIDYANGAVGRFALYTDVGGAPGTLVASTALGPLPYGNVERGLVGGPLVVAAGTYWIVWNFSGTVYPGYTTAGAAGNVIASRSLATSDALPVTFGPADTSTGQLLNLYVLSCP